jgi:hypothetical protein
MRTLPRALGFVYARAHAWLTIESRFRMQARRLEGFLRARIAVVVASGPGAAGRGFASTAWQA